MGKFAGYKTYIVAGLAVLTAAAGYFTGDLTAVQAGQAALTAVLGATIRSGINTAVTSAR